MPKKFLRQVGWILFLGAGALMPGCRGEQKQGAKAKAIQREPTSPTSLPSLPQTDPTREMPALRSRVTMAQLLQRAGPVAFSRDGRLLAVPGAADNTIWVFRTADGSVAGSVQPDCCDAKSLAFSPDGTQLYVGNGGGCFGLLAVFDITSGKMIREFAGDRAGIHQILLSEDGSTLLTSSLYENKYIAWDTSTGRQLWSHQGKSRVSSATLRKDGEVAALRGDTTIVLKNTKTGSLIREFPMTAPIDWLAFQSDGSLLALLRQGESTLVRIDTQTGESKVVASAGGDGDTNLFALSPDGKFFALNAQRGTALRVIDTTGAVPPREFIPWLGSELPSLDGLAFSPDGNTLAFSAGRAAHLYNTQTWEPRPIHEGHAWRIDEARFPDSSTVQTRDSNHVCEWDLASLRQVRRKDWPSDCEVAAVSPTGSHALCRSIGGKSEKTLQVIEHASNRKVAEIKLKVPLYENQIKWPPGKYIFIKRQGEVMQVDPLQGTIIKEIAAEESIWPGMLATEHKIYLLGASGKPPRKEFIREISVQDGSERRLGPVTEPLSILHFGVTPDGSHFWFTTKKETHFVRHDDLAPGPSMNLAASPVQFDPKGSRFLQVYSLNTPNQTSVISVREWPSGREIRHLESPDFRDAIVHFTPDGRSLLVLRQEGILELYPVESPETR